MREQQDSYESLCSKLITIVEDMAQLEGTSGMIPLMKMFGEMQVEAIKDYDGLNLSQQKKD